MLLFSCDARTEYHDWYNKVCTVQELGMMKNLEGGHWHWGREDLVATALHDPHHCIVQDAVMLSHTTPEVLQNSSKTARPKSWNVWHSY